MPTYTQSISKHWVCALLTFASVGGALAFAPATVEAKEPSAIDKRDYDSAFKGLKHEINQQIERKNTIYDSTVERETKEIKVILDRMKRSGVDIAPYQKDVDDFLKDAYERLAAVQVKRLHDNIDKNVPDIQPEDGIEAISVVAPTWCAKIDSTLKHPSSAKSIIIPKSAAEITRFSIRGALEFSCAAKDFDLTQKWVRAYRQQLSNLLGLSQKENLALISFTGDNYRKLDHTAYVKAKEQPTLQACEAFPAPKSKLVEDQRTRQLERSLLRCKASVTSIPQSSRLSASYWFVDIEGYPNTQVAKLGLAAELLRLNSVYDDDLANPMAARDPFKIVNNYGLAGAMNISRDEVLKELGSKGMDEQALWSAKIKAFATLRDLDRARAYIMRLSKANPGFEKIFIEAPAQGYANFSKVAKEGADELELLLAIEDKILREESLEGCAQATYEKLRPWLKSQHKKKKFTHFEDVTFDDYEGSLILQTLVVCGANDTLNTPGMAKMLVEQYYNNTDSQRGPLTAAYKAMLDALNDYALNPPKKTNSFSRSRGGSSDGFKQIDIPGLYPTPIARPLVPPFSHNFAYDKMNMAQVMKTIRGSMQPKSFHVKQGTIQKISKADGDRVKITFKQESYKSAIRDCKETGRIDRIDDNGRLVPQYNCKTVGYETIKVDPKPIEVPEWVTKDLKKGQLLVFYATREKAHKNQPSFGWPLAAFKSKNAKKLVSLYGIKL